MRRSIIIFSLFWSLVTAQSREYIDFQVLVNDNPYSANIFIHSMSMDSRYMAVIDPALNIAWYINSGPLGLDFKVNQELLSYFHKPGQFWILMNEFMIETDTLECAGQYLADYHDIQILDNGGYLLQTFDSILVDMSTVLEGGDTSAMVHLLIIQEFDSIHSLIFEWNAWDHLDIADYTNLDLTQNKIIWMHGNSIDIDIDENILISNRRSSEVIKIDRYSGAVIWRMGGPKNEFLFMDDPFLGFSKQHDVRRIDNGNITLFDNGNLHDPPLSRAVEYEIDEDERIVTLVWDYEHPDGYVGLAMGSVQRLPNQNTLINWGSISDQGAIITEVDHNKNIVLEIQYPSQYHSYKVRKSQWEFATNLLVGDTNMDNMVDIMDLNYIVDHSLSDDIEMDMFHLFRFDLNKDRIFDETDIVQIVENILFD